MERMRATVKQRLLVPVGVALSAVLGSPMTMAQSEPAPLTCPAGMQRLGPKHCCWPGQTLNLERGTCRGTPSCPQGMAISGASCVALPTGVTPSPAAGSTLPVPSPTYSSPAGMDPGCPPGMMPGAPGTCVGSDIPAQNQSAPLQPAPPQAAAQPYLPPAEPPSSPEPASPVPGIADPAPSNAEHAPKREPEALTPARAGRFVLAYLGPSFPLKTNSHQTAYMPGLRLGGLLGFYLGSHVSINGEISMDALEPSASGSTAEPLAGFAFSPLIHFGSPGMEFAVGPRVGYFWSSLYSRDSTENGLLYGLNAGIFFLPVSGVSFGGLVSLTGHHAQEVCPEHQACEKRSGDTPFVLSFTVAIIVPQMCVRRGLRCR
jgi:hypothetical protein